MDHCNYCHAVLFKTDKKNHNCTYSKRGLISETHTLQMNKQSVVAGLYIQFSKNTIKDMTFLNIEFM